ncbi:MAG: RES family NAD+ phosphorylase [Candidatus Acidiferrales bacterium]
MPPRVTDIRRDGTHRLIPAKYVERDESVLTRLLPRDAEEADLRALYELEGATNDRLLGEAGLLPGIGVRELVFGVPHAKIINAAFTHASPMGNRFNGPDRGAWYAAFARRTSEMEVTYHRAKELVEVNWQESQTFTYVDCLADFRAKFHDIRDDTRYEACWKGDDYKASQRLAEDLLERGSAGIVYPSARHRGGACIACFRPALVTHVRKGATLSIVFKAGASSPPETREQK